MIFLGWVKGATKRERSKLKYGTWLIVLVAGGVIGVYLFAQMRTVIEQSVIVKRYEIFSRVFCNE